MPTSSPSPPFSLCSRHTGLFTVPPTHQTGYLPQGLCMGCSLCLECCSPDFPGAPSLSSFKSLWVKHNSQGQLTLAFPCQATPVSPDIRPFTYCLPCHLLSAAEGQGQTRALVPLLRDLLDERHVHEGWGPGLTPGPRDPMVRHAPRLPRPWNWVQARRAAPGPRQARGQPAVLQRGPLPGPLLPPACA